VPRAESAEARDSRRLRQVLVDDKKSLRIEKTLTLTRLGIRGSLKRTLESTNPCESMIVRRTSRNVKRWQSGEMALRWTAAGMLEAERQFRRIIGYRDLAKLAVAVARSLLCRSSNKRRQLRLGCTVAAARRAGESAFQALALERTRPGSRPTAPQALSRRAIFRPGEVQKLEVSVQ
jgi:hypothetical protein